MGKGGEKQSSTKTEATVSDVTEPVEVLINGSFYDVTNMKHPGGTVINFYAGKGIDATQAFDNFHIRSKKASKYLKSLPSRKAKVDSSALLKDFDALTKELEAEGFFKPSYLHVFYRIAEVILMHVIGVYMILNGYYYSGAVVFGVASGRCGWLMHEGGHYSLTGNIAIDRFMQVVIYGVGCGMSGGWWRTQHNKHHSMPQKIGHDVDLNTLPLLAFTEKVAKNVGMSQKVWIRLQAFLFPVVTCFLVASGWQFYLHPRFILRRQKWDEALMLVIRYALFYMTFVPTFGLLGTFKLYCVYNTIAADYIVMNFAVSHTHLPTVPKEDTETDWVQYAAVHTMNCKPGPLNFVNWWMSYLNFQIEHHLFPSMPQHRHPEVSKRVQVLFAKHGVKYDQRGYMESVKVTFQNLHKVGADVFYG
jgi:fatty acid desaturase 2 (delta-6 desaturase)